MPQFDFGNVFVPQRRVLSLRRLVGQDFPRSDKDAPVYRENFVLTAILMVVPPILGIAQAALDHAVESLRRGKKIYYTFYDDAREAAPNTLISHIDGTCAHQVDQPRQPGAERAALEPRAMRERDDRRLRRTRRESSERRGRWVVIGSQAGHPHQAPHAYPVSAGAPTKMSAASRGALPLSLRGRAIAYGEVRVALASTPSLRGAVATKQSISPRKERWIAHMGNVCVKG